MDFDNLVHQSTRLKILSHLYSKGESAFVEMKEELELTEGNLANHLRKLEDAEYVKMEKKFENRKPKTTYRLTEEGKEALEEHIHKLENMIDMMGRE